MLSPGGGWSVKLFRVVEYDRSGPGISVETLKKANSKDLTAAKALVSALKAANLDVDGPSPSNSEGHGIVLPSHRDIQPLGDSATPSAPIELTILFRPPPNLSKGR